MAPAALPTFRALVLADLPAIAASNLTNGVTGSGAIVLQTSPTLITPVLGVATATSINKLTITAPATSATLTIADGKTLTVNQDVTAAGTALSVMGRSANSTGAVADIAGTADQVLRVNTAGTALGFGTIATAGLANNSATYAKIQQGTALSVLGVTGNATANLADIVGTTDQVLRVNTGGTAVGFGTIATGGITANAVTGAKFRQSVARSVVGVTGNVTADVADIQGTADQVLVVNGAGTALAFSTVATAGITANAVTDTKIRQGVARSVIGVTGNSTANVADIQGTADQTLRINSAGTALAFGTLAILGGGTGATTNTAAFNALSPLTTQGDVLYRDGSNNVRLGPGTAGQFLKTLGAAANPAWADTVSSVALQVFTGSGTYTPASGMLYCISFVLGAGGGGGGTAASAATVTQSGGGGGAGGLSIKLSTAAAIGASQAVTIGAAGSAGAASNSAGGNGGDTSLGAICIGKGGTGGGAGGTRTSSPGGVAGTGDIAATGSPGGAAVLTGAAATTALSGGIGGSSPFGGGGVAVAIATGSAATGYGAGGSGGCDFSAGGARAGGAGTAGLVFVIEFIK